MTKQQKDLFIFIQKYMSENDGVSPSFDEMRVALNLKSKSGIHRLVHALQDRGYIEILSFRARAIEIVGGQNHNLNRKLIIELEKIYNFLEIKGLLSECKEYIA